MNQIIFMKEKYPKTDGKLCMYCEQPMTFVSAKERTKAEQSLFDNMVDKTKELKKLEKAL